MNKLLTISELFQFTNQNKPNEPPIINKQQEEVSGFDELLKGWIKEIKNANK